MVMIMMDTRHFAKLTIHKLQEKIYKLTNTRLAAANRSCVNIRDQPFENSHLV